jgi:hypothetical protein
MNMPTFTAEASLYQTTRHYRAGRYTIDSSAQTVGPIWPAAREQEGEVIDVCKDDPSKCWPPPLTEPPIIWGGGDGPPGGGPDDGGPGGGGPYGTKKYPYAPPEGSHLCGAKKGDPVVVDTPGLKECHDKNLEPHPPGSYHTYCGPKKKDIFCCFEDKTHYFTCQRFEGPKASR